ncbi:endonuclease domain-containing protein [Sinomicrobium sp. M5D2P9]
MNKKHPYHDESMWKGAFAQIFARAKVLRESMTEAEKLLWEELKGNKLDGYKFRRQHPIHKFIADFYCHKLNLIIELDGEYHNSPEQKKLDLEREELLTFQEIKVIRFTNDQVLNNMDMVMQEIREMIYNLNTE